MAKENTDWFREDQEEWWDQVKQEEDLRKQVENQLLIESRKHQEDLKVLLKAILALKFPK